MATKQRTRNPQNATLRNVRAATKRLAKLERQFKLFARQFQALLKVTRQRGARIPVRTPRKRTAATAPKPAMGVPSDVIGVNG